MLDIRDNLSGRIYQDISSLICITIIVYDPVKDSINDYEVYVRVPRMLNI